MGNAKRLVAAITDMGKRVNSIICGGWTITKESVESLIPVLQAKLSVVMSTIPKRKHKRSDIEANYRNETKTF